MKEEKEILSPYASIVKASAGTGKTFRLSNKFISLLAAGEKPEKILATTFTRKAAGEIRERLFLRLAEACLNQKAASELSDFIGYPAFDCSSYTALLHDLIKDQHRLRICTLDSLCVQIASSFSFELGLPPGWSIMDEAFNRQIVSETVQTLLLEEEDDLLALLRLLNAGDFSRAVSNQIHSAVLTLHDLYRQTDREAWDWLKIPPALPASELVELIERLKSLDVALTSKNQPNKNWLKAKEKDCNSAISADWKTFIKSGLLKTSLENNGTYYKAPMEDEMRECYLALLSHARSVILEEISEQTRATYKLLQIFDKIYEDKKYSARQLRFSDVKHAIAGAPVFDVLHSLYYRLDSQISHLLLDEFQDTSFDEWKVLFPLADEILSKASAENSFFCVGDLKQAIYGWRGGLAGIFHSLKQTWSHLSEEPLDETYRCAPTVIELVNKVFEGIDSNAALVKYRPAVESWCSDFREHKSQKKDAIGYAEIRSVSFAEDKEEQENLLYQEVIDLIKAQYGASTETTIAVLFRTNGKVGNFIRRVRAQCPEIEASEEGRSTLLDSEMVRLLLAFIIVADNPANTIACFHVASSPLGEAYGFTNYNDEVAASDLSYRLRAALQSNGYGKTLQEWYFILAAHSSEEEKDRLKQLIELAFLYDKRVGDRARDFIEFVNLQRVESQKEARLRVMTIHQSKGLEFDSVILPDFDEDLIKTKGDSFLSQRLEALSPINRVLKNSSTEVRNLEPAYENMYQKMQSDRLEESLSILYVALTRAKNGLHVLLSPSRENEKNLPLSYAGILRAACGYDSGLLDADNLLYETGKKNWFRLVKVDSESSESIQAEKQKSVLLKELIKSPSKPGMQIKSPSKLAGGGFVDLSLAMNLQTHEGMLWGNLLHAFFEKIEWSSEPLPAIDELSSIGLSLGAESPLVQRATDAFMACLKSGEIASSLQKSAYADFVAGDSQTLEVWRERPFATRVQGILYKGVFDRVVIGRNASREIVFADILDFKTDRLQENAETKIAHYKPQIEAYRTALANLLKVKPTLITAKLLFVGDDRVVAVF